MSFATRQRLSPATQVRVDLALAVRRRSAPLVVGEAALAGRLGLPLGLARGHVARGHLDGGLARLVLAHPHRHHGVTRAVAGAAVEQRVARAQGVGHQVEGVARVGQVGGAGVDQQYPDEVAGALVEVDLVEVGANARALEQEGLVIVGDGAAAAQLCVLGPLLEQLLLGQAAGEHGVVLVIGGEAGHAAPLAILGAHAEVSEEDARLAVEALDVEGQVVPGREGGPQKDPDVCAVQPRRGQRLAPGCGQLEGLAVGGLVGVDLFEAGDPGGELLVPVEPAVGRPGHPGPLGRRGVGILPLVVHRPDAGGSAADGAVESGHAHAVLLAELAARRERRRALVRILVTRAATSQRANDEIHQQPGSLDHT